MKIQLRKQPRGMSLSFKAGADPEGADLKDAVLAFAKDSTVGALLDKLQELGYEAALTKHGRTASEFTLAKRKGAGNANPS